MVLRYGMSDVLGNVVYDRENSTFIQPGVPMPQSRNYSESTAKSVDNAIHILVEEAFKKAISILKTNRSLLDHTAEELLNSETLNQPKIKELKQKIIIKPISKTTVSKKTI